MSAPTAEIVLTNRTLRWSHPDKFDDELDVAQVCDEKMDENKQKQIQDAVINLILNPPPILKKNANKLFTHLVSLISLLGSDKTLAISELKEFPMDISSSIADINKCYKENIRNDFRILCLGIEKNNHRLWNDYAEAYKGAVIELACRDDSDSSWRIAKPVEYVNEKDLFLTAEDWATVLCLETNKATEYIIEKCCLKKAKDNKNKWFEQNEWRIYNFRKYYEAGLTSDYRVNPNDFTAIYFGHKMAVKAQNNLLRLLDGNLDHISAFRCELDSSNKITFIKLK